MAIDPSTGAGFACTRALLGLSGAQLAEILGVTDRTIRRWEAGHDRIPDGVIAEMYRLQADAKKAVWELEKRINNGLSVVITYRTDDDYRAAGGTMPASWHRAIAARASARSTGATIIYAGDRLTLSVDLIPVEQWADTPRAREVLAVGKHDVMSQMPGDDVTAISRHEYVVEPGRGPLTGPDVYEIVYVPGKSASHPLDVRQVPGNRHHTLPGGSLRPLLTLRRSNASIDGSLPVPVPDGLSLVHQGARYRLVLTGQGELRLRPDGWVDDAPAVSA